MSLTGISGTAPGNVDFIATPALKSEAPIAQGRVVVQIEDSACRASRPVNKCRFVEGGTIVLELFAQLVERFSAGEDWVSSHALDRAVIRIEDLVDCKLIVSLDDTVVP